MIETRSRLLATLLAGALALTFTAPSFAETTRRPAEAAKEQSAEANRLPADVTTEQTVELPDRTLRFKATAGSIPINNAEGKLQAEIAYIAYVRPDSDAAGRPVTFVFNGGPGASSAYLQLGAMGPWRLPLDNLTPSSTPATVPNPETWLDFTDLVFVDPVGTGYSRFINTSDEVRKQFWSVDGDIDVLATFMRKWIEKAGRQASRKFIAGESYGGFRAPRLASKLNEQGVAVSGLVLMSTPLDLGWRGHGRHSPLAWVSRLPSMAAAIREEKSSFDREALREVERYAGGEYLQDLLRGERDGAAIERITARVAPLIGLDPALVRRRAGRIDIRTFQRERSHGSVVSMYDATVRGIDPDPSASYSNFEDPVLNGLRAPLSSAMTSLYARVLNWRVEEPYQLLNGRVNSRWDWGAGRSTQEIVSDLRSVLAADPKLRVLVTHGASDLVTPYFETQMILDQMPAFASPDRLKSMVYGGGHMYYSRDASRRALREDAKELYRASEQAPRG
ncbi:MAG: peptidase S10 [Xanthobacteraceae bacterium]